MDKKWLPAISGTIAVLAFTVVTVLRLAPGDDRTATLPPPEPAFTLPGVTSGPQLPISLLPSDTPGPTRSVEAGRASETVPAGDTTRDPQPAPRPTPPGVTGAFRVIDSYPDSFIGEVLVRNDTGAGQSWHVTLVYPGDLVTSWLESLPQPTLVQRGTTYTWTSSVPLAAHSTGAMRFHFRLSGAAAPKDCAVNGAACS
ncbi:hypothetical protein [Actinoplanes sp. NPDC026619]|uniref:hypothetical protein n=1 Tax=Actinoplanes sp. NPDC026619 TaxID=3155798 RepID=UPI0033D65403